MKIVLVGGGSFRTLPIVRGIMRDPAVLAGGEIQIVDRDAGRAEVVGRLIQRTPEYAAAPCTVGWGTSLDSALPGADAVSLVIPVGSREVCRRSDTVSLEHGQPGSDQLSVSGAFRSLTGGEVVRDLVRRMERHCPAAWFLCFANPVAVYSGYVNNHTRIKALGICAGYTNHRWDLTRLLLGRDEYRDEYEVAVAGVNHLSFIHHGTWKGKDLHQALARRLARKAPGPRIEGPPAHRANVARSLWAMREAFRRHGQIIFSTEGDGLTALFPQEGLEYSRRHPRPRVTAAQARREAAAQAQERARADAEYAAHLQGDLGPAFWKAADRDGGKFAAACGDITIGVVHALAGGRPRTLAASRPHRGAVAGFADRTVLEHSFVLDGGRLEPLPGLTVADPVRGLIAGLSAHQTLLGDAIATQDPRIFAQALAAWPVAYGTERSRDLWRAQLKVHAAEIPAVFQRAAEWF